METRRALLFTLRMAVAFMRIPFSSAVFAQEHFRVYGWLVIANSVLGLLILIPLSRAGSSLLVVYSLLLLDSILILLIPGLSS